MDISWSINEIESVSPHYVQLNLFSNHPNVMNKEELKNKENRDKLTFAINVVEINSIGRHDNHRKEKCNWVECKL